MLLLLFAALSAEDEVLRIGSLVVVDAPHGHLDGARSDVVDELAVVADDDDCGGAVGDETLKPADGLDVKMIRGLIEKEQVGLLQQELCQFDSHAPSAAELARRAGEVRAGEAEAEERLLDVFFKVCEVDGIEFLAHVCHLLYEAHIFFALIVRASGELGVQSLNLALHVVEMGEGRGRLFIDGAAIFGHEVLGEIGYRAVARCADAAARGLPHSCQNLQECGFAGAVLAHEGYAVFLVDLETDVAEEGGAAKFYGKAFNGNHGASR